MTGKVKLGLVAAMEREIKPLVRGWRIVPVNAGARNTKAFVRADTALMCAGIGDAGPVTRMLIESFDPEVVISVGFAGSLNPDLQVPAVLIPARVVDGKTGTEFCTEIGNGTLVTAGHIADVKTKRELANAFSADAVDMEASQVAKEAQIAGRRFLAIKVISDDADSDISFVSDFVEGHGFDTAGFLAHVAFRPRLWGAVRNLQVNSNRAQQVLCSYLEFIIQNTSRLDIALTRTGTCGVVSAAK